MCPIQQELKITLESKEWAGARMRAVERDKGYVKHAAPLQESKPHPVITKCTKPHPLFTIYAHVFDLYFGNH